MPEPENAPVQTVSAAELIGDLPPVTPAVVNAALPPMESATAPEAAPATATARQNSSSAQPGPGAAAPRPSTPWDDERDSLNRAWDAEKFASNADGSPRRDRLARFIPRGLGRKPVVAAEPARAEGSFVAPPPTAPTPPAAVVENATVETVIGIVQMLLILIGDEEGVLSSAEKLLLRPPLERLLRKYEIGADALPAEVECLMAVAGIVIERIKRGGKTASAFAKCKAWLAGVFFRAKGMQVGAQARREVPADLVASLQAQVERLSAEVAASRAHKVETPSVAAPAGAEVKP